VNILVPLGGSPLAERALGPAGLRAATGVRTGGIAESAARAEPAPRLTLSPREHQLVGYGLELLHDGTDRAPSLTGPIADLIARVGGTPPSRGAGSESASRFTRRLPPATDRVTGPRDDRSDWG
jgi:hypothetical protein